MLSVILDRNGQVLRLQGIQEGGDGTVTMPLDAALALLVLGAQTPVQHGRFQLGVRAVLARGDGNTQQFEAAPLAEGLIVLVGHGLATGHAAALLDGQILVLEEAPDIRILDLVLGLVGISLDQSLELDLQALGQVQVVVGLEQIGHSPLAGLGVHTDDGLITTTDILGVHGQIGHQPEVVLRIRVVAQSGLLAGVQTLLDGILVGAGEGRVDEVAGVGVPLGDLDLVAVLHGSADIRHVGEIQLGVDALDQHVQPDRADVNVAGTLPVAQEAPLDPVCTGQEAQFGGGHGHALVVVWVEGEDHGISVVQVVRDVLHLVGEDVGGGHLDRVGQVDDHRMLRCRLDHIDDRVADVKGELGLGPGEGLG